MNNERRESDLRLTKGRVSPGDLTQKDEDSKLQLDPDKL